MVYSQKREILTSKGSIMFYLQSKGVAMKRKLLILSVFVIMIGLFPLKSMSATGDIASGNDCGVDWRITSGGDLIIGTAGKTQSFTIYNTAPWKPYNKSVKTVRFAGSVTGQGDINSMFTGCESLYSVDFTGFNTINVTNMDSMFSSCKSLEHLDLSGLDTRNVTYMGYMFSGCSSLCNLNLTGLNTKKVTNMGGMFSECSSLKNLDLSGFDTSNVTEMYWMFSKSGLVNLDLSGFDTRSVVHMNNMFWNCTSLVSLDLSGFDNRNVTDVTQMFQGCSSLTDINLSGFNTSNITSFGSIFKGCSSLKSLNLSGFDTSNLTSMGGMFSDCSSLTYINFSGFDTSKVTSMINLFYNCSSLTNLDLSGFDTRNLKNPSGMFSGCSALKTLDISSFNMRNVSSEIEMFTGCSSLKSLNAPINVGVDIDLPIVMIDSEAKEYTVLPKNLSSSILLNRKPCNHQWDAGKITKKAGYTHTGTKVYTCTICGDTKSSTIPKLNASAITPAKVAISSAKVSGKTVTLTWKKVAKKTKGYQVAVKNKKTKKVKYYTVKASSKSKISKKIKLKKGTYAVRVRAYNIVEGKKFYGSWSKSKVGKIK